MWRNTIFDRAIWLSPPLTRVGPSTEIKQPPRERGDVNLEHVKGWWPQPKLQQTLILAMIHLPVWFKRSKSPNTWLFLWEPSGVWALLQALPEAETRCSLWQSTSKWVPPSPGWAVAFGESYCCFPKCGTEICWGVEWSIQQPGASMCVYTWLVWQLS